MLVESNTGRRPAQQLCQRSLTLLDRCLTKILAVEPEQIEGAKHNIFVVAAPADHLEDREAIVVAGDCFAVNETRACRQSRNRDSG
jgi:hypothetical protein